MNCIPGGNPVSAAFSTLLKNIRLIKMSNNGTYVFEGAKIEIEKYKGSGFSSKEDFEFEERSRIMRGLAKLVEDYENRFRPTKARFVYYHGVQEIKIESAGESMPVSDKPAFSGIIKYLPPYAGFDVTGDYSGRVKAIFNLEPRIGAGKEVDGLDEIIRESGFHGSIEKINVERDIF